jgi:hypothetical protein
MSTITKKFLYALEAKGAKVCDDITITANDDGNFDMYLQDGTAMTSMILDVEFVQGQVDGSGVFTAGTGASDTHWLKITRPFGQITYKPLKGVNDLLGADIDSEISNFQELAENINALETAVSEAMAAQQTARVGDVQRLENSFIDFLTALQLNLTNIKTDIKSYIDAGDQGILTYADTSLGRFADAVEATMQRDYKYAASSFGNFATGEDVEFQFSLDDSGEAVRLDPAKWIVNVRRKEVGTGDNPVHKLHNDEISHKVTCDGDKLKVHVQAAECGQAYVSDLLCVTAIYCGDLDYTVTLDENGQPTADATGIDAPVSTTSTPAVYHSGEGSAVFDAPLGDSDANPFEPKITEPAGESS